MRSARRNRRQGNVHVDAHSNHWYIARHGGEPDTHSRLATDRGLAADCIVRFRSFTNP
jgi:hypothetical protein